MSFQYPSDGSAFVRYAADARLRRIGRRARRAHRRAQRVRRAG